MRAVKPRLGILASSIGGFDGNAQYGQTSYYYGTANLAAAVQQSPARIGLNPIPPANYLSAVGVTGQVQMHVGSQWAPSPYVEYGLAASNHPDACWQVIDEMLSKGRRLGDSTEALWEATLPGRRSSGSHNSLYTIRWTGGRRCVV